MTDRELMDGFAAATIDPAAFGHRQHLRVGWLCLRRYGVAETERRLIAGLRALAVRAGRPEKFDEALTRAWVARIAAAAAPLPPGHSFDDLLRSSRALLDPAAVGGSGKRYNPGTGPMPLRLIPHIHRATHRIGLHIAELRDPTVNQAEAHVLAHLAGAGEATIGEVHRAFGHRRSTLTSILDRLEERHLIARTSDARDRRTFVVSLTRTGRSAARRVVQHLAALERRALQRVPAADARAFLRVLERFDGDEE